MKSKNLIKTENIIIFYYWKNEKSYFDFNFQKIETCFLIYGNF